VNKSELVMKVAREAGVSKSDASKVLDAMLKVIAGTLRERER